MRKLLSALSIVGSVVLATGCASGKRTDTTVVSKEDPAAEHRAAWVKALATGGHCVPDRPSSFKGVCLASAGYPEARRSAPVPATSRLWGMTFRERYQGAKRLQQDFNLATLELTPTPEGAVQVAFFELWPESEPDIDYMGSACEQLDDHYFRGGSSLPEGRMVQRLRAGLEQGERVRREALQPTPQGYRGGPQGLELRAFQQGWMLATEELDAESGEETRVFGVFLPWPES
jgi:hypothetical protein